MSTGRTLTKRQKMAVIDAVLALNAALIGEKQDVFATPGAKGWIRVGYRRGVVNAPRSYGVDPRSYLNIDVAVEVARVALRRALALYDEANLRGGVYTDIAS